MINRLDRMTKLHLSNMKITIGDRTSISSIQVDKDTCSDQIGFQHKITLQDLAFVPGLLSNLFSITKALGRKAILSSNRDRMEIKKKTWKLFVDLQVKTKNSYVPGACITPINHIDAEGHCVFQSPQSTWTHE